MELSSFSCLIVLSGTYSTMLTRTCESGHPCFVPALKGKALSFSLLIIMLVEDTQILALITSGTGL